MSHFYGTLWGSRGQATRCGTKKSGMVVVAASWAGSICVSLIVDADGRDVYEVSLEPWQGIGVREVIARGYVGQLPDIEAP